MLLIFSANKIFAQESYVYNLKAENGLEDNTVYDIHLSKEGFLYAGTSRGLAKYDGKKFEQISLSNMLKETTEFYETENGHLFFLTFNGRIYCYQNDSVQLINNLAKQGLQYPSMNLLNNNEIIYTAIDGYYLYHTDSNRSQYISLPVKEIRKKSKSVLMGKINDGVVLSIIPHLFLVDSLGRAKEINRNELTEVYKFARAWNGRNLMFGANTSGQFVLSEVIGDRLVRIKTLTNVHFSDLLNISITDNRLFLLMKDGIHELDQNFIELPNKISSVKNVSELIIHNNSIYISTLHNGIFVKPNSGIQNVSKLFNNETVFHLYSYKDQLFYITDKAKLKSKFSHWKFNEINIETPYKLDLDKYGNLFLMSAGSSFLLNLNSGSRRNFLRYNMYGHGYYIKTLEAYFVSTNFNQSFLMDNLSTYNVLAHKWKNKLNYKLDGKFSSTSKSDSSGVITISANANVNSCFNIKDTTFYLLNASGLQHYKSNKQVVDIRYNGQDVIAKEALTMSDGTFYMNGLDGLYKVKGDAVLKKITTKDGLFTNQIERLKQQGDTIILFERDALQIYTDLDGVLQTISTKSDLENAVIYDAAICKGLVYVSTINGVYTIPLHRSQQEKPKAFIRYVKAGDARWPVGKAIPFENNDIVFRVNGNSIVNRAAFHYEYLLTGASNKKWVEQDASLNDVRFSSLTEGDYVFKLKVVTDLGTESEVVSYPFTVKPPFIRSTLFYFICFLLVLGILSFIFWLRVRTIRRKSEFQRQVKQSEITAIKAQMNPHFIFNALNSVQDLMLDDKLEESLTYLGKFSDLVRRTLATSDANNLPLSEELKMIQLYIDLEKLRFGNSISVDIQIDVEANMEDIIVPALLIQPYIENVFKHGLMHKEGDKNLWLRCSIKDKLLLVEIKDNGVGRAQSKAMQENRNYQSFSSDANEKRLTLLREIYDAEIIVEITDAFPTNENLGTLVKLQLPILEPYS